VNTYEVTRDHPISLQDGTILRGDIYRLTHLPEAPVILFRTPYVKERLWNEVFSPMDALEAGFNAYVQDMRGFGRSDGSPNIIDWRQEDQDSFDTVEALTGESWCSGNLAIGGTSFLGMVALSSLNNRHPAVKAIFPSMVAVDPFEASLTQPWFRFEEVLVWLVQMALQKAMRREAGQTAKLSDAEKAAFTDLNNLSGLFARIETSGLPTYLQELEGGVISKILSGEINPFPHISNSAMGSVPALFLTGWYDTFSNATTALGDAWRQARQAENDSAVIVGPWTHSNQLTANIGQLNFGSKASGSAAGVVRRHTQFLRDVFKGAKPQAYGLEFELFGDSWTNEAPAKSNLKIDLYRQAVGGGAGLPGVLAPSYGGQVHFSGGGIPGPVDLSPLIARDDALYFESAAFAEAVSLSESVEVQMPWSEAGTDAIFMRLVVKNEQAQIFPVQELVHSARAGEAKVKFPRVRAKLNRGWRLGVIVTPACYPRYYSDKSGSNPPPLPELGGEIFLTA